MTKTKVLGTIVAVIVVIYGLVTGLTINEKIAVLESAIATIKANTGAIEALSEKVAELEAKGVEEAETPVVTEEENFVEEGTSTVGGLVACTPWPQPAVAPGNYTGNTELLNAYSHAVGCVLPKWVYDSIVFRFAKPLTQPNQVHVWFKNAGISGRLKVERWSEGVHMYIDEIVTNKGVGNLFQYLVKNDVALSTYIAAFDGNYIESIELR